VITGPVTASHPVTESVVLPPQVRDYIMPSLAVLFDPSRVAIQPHPCPRCLGPMVLTQIKPSQFVYAAPRTDHAGLGFVVRGDIATPSMVRVRSS
jgi:hypothetical protein